MEMKHRTHNQPPQGEMRKYLRSHGTSAEASMWLLLKARQMDGVKFRRQFSVGPYIPDFYAPELKLCIELDGAPHYTYDGAESDRIRSEYLMTHHSIHIIRFENELLFKNTEGVIEMIREAIRVRREALLQSHLQTPPPYGHLP